MLSAMFFLDSLRLRNFRSFRDTGWIDRRPIVVLVGANSSGKSSIARFFPLLRQTLASPSRSPLLWYGEEVDFGDFQGALCQAAEEPEIAVELAFEGLSGGDWVTSQWRINLRADNGSTYVSSYECCVADLHVTLRLRDSELTAVVKEREAEVLFELAIDEHVIKERQLIPYIDLPWLAFKLREGLDETCQSTAYIGPFRQPPQRYYRVQELTTHRLDAYGKNLAMFVHALPDTLRTSLAEWLERYFGLRLHVAQESQHVTLTIEHSGRSFSLVDMGYGISQMLPVILQCWAATLSHGNTGPGDLTVPELLVIEQPELHLHPRYQERLADMFVGLSRVSDGVTRSIIETHSKVMINRFGELVEEGTLAHDQISVLLVEKDDETGVSTVRVAEFDERGVLKNWPVGFFAP